MEHLTKDKNGNLILELSKEEIAEFKERQIGTSSLENYIFEFVFGTDDYRYMSEDEQIMLGDLTSCCEITTMDEDPDKDWNEESWIYPIYTSAWFIDLLEHSITFIKRGNM